jgi:hypothetical protein
VFRVHTKSLVASEADIEMMLYESQVKKEQKRSSVLREFLDSPLVRKAGLQCLEDWSESEVIRLWKTLHKNVGGLSMKEISNALQGSKSTKDIAQFLCQSCEGVARAVPGTFICGTCNKKDVKHLCKLYFKCHTGYCTGCFNSVPRRGVRYLGLPPAKGTSEKSKVILDDEMFWICDQCVTETSRYNDSTKSTGGTMKTKKSESARIPKKEQVKKTPTVKPKAEPEHPPIQLLDTNDGYNPNLSWTKTSMKLAHGSSLVDAVNTLDEILYLFPKATYKSIVHSLEEREHMFISNKQLMHELEALSTVDNSSTEPKVNDLLKTFYPPIRGNQSIEKVNK